MLISIGSVSGNPKARPPWKDISSNTDNFIEAEYLPDGFIMQEPTKLVEAQLDRLMNHWYDRQQAKQVVFSLKGYKSKDGQILPPVQVSTTKDSKQNSKGKGKGKHHGKSKGKKPARAKTAPVRSDSEQEDFDFGSDDDTGSESDIDSIVSGRQNTMSKPNATSESADHAALEQTRELIKTLSSTTKVEGKANLGDKPVATTVPADVAGKGDVPLEQGQVSVVFKPESTPTVKNRMVPTVLLNPALSSATQKTVKPEQTEEKHNIKPDVSSAIVDLTEPEAGTGQPSAGTSQHLPELSAKDQQATRSRGRKATRPMITDEMNDPTEKLVPMMTRASQKRKETELAERVVKKTRAATKSTRR